MAFSFESGKALALIRGGVDDGEIVFIDTSPDCQCEDCNLKRCKKAPCCSGCCYHNEGGGRLESKDLETDGTFEMVPNETDRIIYIAGPSGSGKSTFAGKYIEKYRRLHPEAPFFVFSRLPDDPAIDHLEPHRVALDDELVETPIEITEEVVPGTVILFDDTDTLQNKKIQTAVNKIKADIMEIGRHLDIKCVITSHLVNANDRATTRTTLNELNTLTVFPHAGSAYQIGYCLKQYFGFSAKQIKALLDLPSRWVTIFKNYPNIVLSEKRCLLASELV
jgi:adenosyl cobinamide kinase/adenosyl cobinamide phosphate guanylyltransferase